LYDELENTRESFRRCAELNCHGVELDAFLLRDGNVVVFHGGHGPGLPPGDVSKHVINTIIASSSSSSSSSREGDDGTGDYSDITGGRTQTPRTPRTTSIMDLTYPEVQGLRFNPCYAEFTSHARTKLLLMQQRQEPDNTSNCNMNDEYRIPLLKDVLCDMKETKLHVKIELKGHVKDIVLPVLELVEQLDMVEQCSYSSFDHDLLRTLRQLRPQQQVVVADSRRRHVYRTGALFDGATPDKGLPVDFVQQALDAGADEVHLRYDACTVARIAQIHTAGLTSMAWFRGPLSMQSDLARRFWDVGTSTSSSSSMNMSSCTSKGGNPQTGDNDGTIVVVDDDEDDVQFLEDAACYQCVLETGVQQICVNRPDVAMAMLVASYPASPSSSSSS
jgi:glycerophosphoryl diester phosphodiesterase